MESVKRAEPVDAERLEETLRSFLEKTAVKTACALGISNSMDNNKLVSPMVYINSGKTIYEPADTIEPGLGTPSLFAKREFSLKGTSGCVCYNITDTDLMLCVLWFCSLSEKLFENRFNVHIMKKGDCDVNLYKMLYNESSKSADGELKRSENGFVVFSKMETESKTVLFVECSKEESQLSRLDQETIKAGDELKGRCRDLRDQITSKRVCVIGINNWSEDRTFGNPKHYLEHGKCVFEPLDMVEPQTGSLAAFVKKSGALRGTSGCMTYDIGDTDLMIIIYWVVPLSEKMHENRFNVHCLKREEYSPELLRVLKGDSVRAVDGVLVREENGLKVEAVMENDERAILVVDCRINQ